MTITLQLAEKSLLGTMLEENYLIADLQIRSEHFTSVQHQTIFRALQTLYREGKNIDFITLLAAIEDPAAVGGANYVFDLKSFANAKHVEAYAQILRDHFREQKKRQILLVAQQDDWELGKIQHELDALVDDDCVQDLSIMQDLVDAADRPYTPDASSAGIMSQLRDFDLMTNGFKGGELFIIAARPSMGKTDTMNHFAVTAGLNGCLPIIFSLEMKRQTLIDRFITAVGSINRLNLRNPYETMSEQQKAKWTQAIGILNNANIQVDDRPGLTVADIRATARKTIKQHPERKPIIFIDYLQIIRPHDVKATQTQQIGQISWDLKQMAREFDCPVVCLSQLNRGVEQRQDKRPVMSDLRDSGNIEQDADVIAFLYRDFYYNKSSQNQQLLEIIIAKNRNGPTGTVKVAYAKETGRLVNVVGANAR